MQELKQIKEQVAYILEHYPNARNSDKLLQVLMLKKFYKVYYIDDILKKPVPSLESIRRCRQKLQAEGKYKSSKSIMQERQELEQVYKEFATTRE